MRKFLFLYNNNNDDAFYFTIMRMILHLMENALLSSNVFKQTCVISNFLFSCVSLNNLTILYYLLNSLVPYKTVFIISVFLIIKQFGQHTIIL